MTDPLSLAADIERVRLRCEDARAAHAVAWTWLARCRVAKDAAGVIRRKQDILDTRSRLMVERAEHARLLAELVALAEGQTTP